MENPAEEIQAMHTELEQLRDRLRTENDAQGYEILQLRADKARLVEALDKSNKYLGSHPAFNALRQCRDNKQLLTEIEQK